MPEYHVCGPGCTEQDLTTTTYCWNCNDVCYLLCYNIMQRKGALQFEKHSPVQLICNKCRCDGAKRKRKNSNGTEAVEQRDSKVQRTTSIQSTPAHTSTTSSDSNNIAKLLASLDSKLDKIAESTNLIKTIDSNVTKLSDDFVTMPSKITSSIKSVPCSSNLSPAPQKPSFANALRQKQNHTVPKTPKTPINQNNASQSIASVTPKSSKVINRPPKASECTSTINFDFTTIAPTAIPVDPPANSFDRMIWLGGVPGKIPLTELKLFIEKQFDMDSTDKITLKPLIVKDKNACDFEFISYKIGVDSCETFEQLLDSSKWPKGCRIREFIDRAKKVTFGDFFPKTQSPTANKDSTNTNRQSPKTYSPSKQTNSIATSSSAPAAKI